MSFSKAKIQRFNELTSVAPAPGSYDPKFDSKGKGFGIEKPGRFTDNRSVASSGADCNSVSSKGAAPLVSPKFRTPQLLKKRIPRAIPSSCPKAKTKLILNPKEVKYDTRDELADLKVELVNKDKTIRDYEKCIDDMKIEVKRLEKSLEEMEGNQRDVEEQCKKDLEAMANLQQDILNSHEEKYTSEIITVRTQLLDALEAKKNEHSACKAVEEDQKSQIAELSSKSEALETELISEKRKTKEYDELFEKFQKLERAMESREREFIEQLNEMEINKEIIVAELTDAIVESEKKIIEVREEMKQLKITTTTLTEDLLNSRRTNEYLQMEYERLRTESEVSTTRQSTLEDTLETRQQVILHLQSQLSSLQCEMDELKAENEKITCDTQHQLSQLISTHQTELAELSTNFLCKTHKFEAERESNLSKQQEINRKNQELLIKNDALIGEISEVQRKHEELKLSFCEIENELDNEREFSDILEENHREEMRKLKTQIDELQSQSKKQKKSPKNSPRGSPKLDEKLFEEKLQERDAEISKLSLELEELKMASETQESFSQSLQEELDRAEGELASKKKELKDLKEQIREETAEMVTRRRRFDVVMAENQATVAALSQRLAESTEELERVQQELKLSEDLLLEHRDLLNNMRNSSNSVNQQLQSLIDKVNLKKIDEIEESNMHEIQTLKCLFESKIDELKNVSLREMKILQEEMKKKDAKNLDLRNEIRKMADRMNSIQDTLLLLEEQSDAQCIEISELQLAKTKVEEELRRQIEESEVVESSLESEIEKYKSITKSAEDRADELLEMLETLRVNETKQENLQRAFDEQKEMLRVEMETRKSVEEETKKLVESCSRLKEDYEELVGKYGEVLGNSSHKQSMKQLNQLNERIVKLEKDLEEKNSVIEQQCKSIERLQADERRRTFTKGKENFGTISKSPFGTPVSSPCKPLTPLRERNE